MQAAASKPTNAWAAFDVLPVKPKRLRAQARGVLDDWKCPVTGSLNCILHGGHYMRRTGMTYKFYSKESGANYMVSQAGRDAYAEHCAKLKAEKEALLRNPDYLEAKLRREKLRQKQTDADWYDRNRAKVKVRVKKMRDLNPQKYETYMRNWYLLNREKIIAKKSMRLLAKRMAKEKAA